MTKETPYQRGELERHLSKLPPSAAAAMADCHLAPEFAGIIDRSWAQSALDAGGMALPALLEALLPAAKSFSRCPVSKFQAGAIAVGETGALYYGANFEAQGTALGHTLHAEQAAILNAWLSGEVGIAGLAVSDAPCGHCRQFLFELPSGGNLTLWISGRAPTRLGELLPDAFGPAHLGVSGGLMSPGRRSLRLISSAADDALVAAALDAAEQSYAPYSLGHAGAAIELRDGRMFAGRYAENAAFNPSASPMLCAVSQMRLGREALGAITRCVLVQSEPAPVSQTAAASDLMQALTGLPVAVHAARSAP